MLPDPLATRRGRLAAFFALYVAEGIPQGFAAVAVAAELRRQGAQPAEIGAFVAAFYLPWALKWVFGPFIDVFRSRRFGHRRGWILLLQLLMEVHDLRPRGGALYTVLAELYSNALEHGVMSLESRLKCDAQGFARYYEERRRRLESLDHGFVRFHIDLTPHGDGGRLLVRVEDSGNGFDVNAVLQAQAQCAPGSFSGRGLTLVRSLADRCQWSADGKSVSVEFFWSAQA